MRSYLLPNKSAEMLIMAESVYDIRVTMDGEQRQIIHFTTEGTNEDEQEMHLTDVNMDGYPDLALLRSMGASDGFASHYVYDPAAGEFVHHPELDDLVVVSLCVLPRRALCAE